MNIKDITLISFGYFDDDFLRKISKILQSELHANIKLKEGHLDLSDYYDANRRQYDANRLIEYLENEYSVDNVKTIGLFNVDLFIPIFTYIFGQAYLNGRTAVASLFRLNNARYGIDADENILLERFSKEIIHEIGHTFGLIHCHTPHCVMRSVTYVEDIDQKESGFCAHCREELLKLN